jgi:hypothetical protein
MDEVRELAEPGVEDRVAVLTPEQSALVKAILDELKEPLPGAGKISCWPTELPGTKYLFVPDTGPIAYVCGERVETIDGAFRDPGARLADLAVQVIVAAADRVPREGCDDCVELELGGVFECLCGDRKLPHSLSSWQYELVIRSNNCYSYAWNKRMCGRQQGSVPGNRFPDSLDELLAGIREDGLEPVTDADFIAAGGVSSTGRFVALLADVRGGHHFLRLDGGYWTHKVGSRAVSTCDRDRLAIPWNGLPTASFDAGFTVRRYYRVPPALRLAHCF